MTHVEKDPLIFSGTSHPELSAEIAANLQLPLGKIKIDRFADGEIRIEILEVVRGRDAYVIQSPALDPNNYLMELLIIMDALKRASARSIIAVLPYFSYSRQDRKDKPRVPISAKLVANLLAAAGATRVLTMDLHASQVEGFFEVPVDNLSAMPILVKELHRIGLDAKPGENVIVTPDLGSVKLARKFAKRLGWEIAIIDKRRSLDQIEVLNLIGSVEGKHALLIDDMCSTAGTLGQAARACKDKGAKSVRAMVTHGLFVGDAVKNIVNSPIEAIMMTNTIPRTDRLKGLNHDVTVSIASLFAHAIRCIQKNESFLLFEQEMNS